MAENASSLAGNLRAARTRAGMTQQQLAVAAGLAVSIVSQIEQGTTPDPRLSTTLALAAALGVTVDALAGVNGVKGKRKKA